MQRCPCCKARLKGAVSCPRCKAELLEIIRARKLAKFWYQKAIDCYLNNEKQYCLDALTRSLQLRHSESAWLFRAFVIERQKQTTRFFNLHRFVQDIFLSGFCSLAIKSFSKESIASTIRKSTRYVWGVFGYLRMFVNSTITAVVKKLRTVLQW